MILIFLQYKVGCRAEHAVQRGKLLGNKAGYFLQVAALQGYKKVKAAGYKIYGIHLRVFINPLRNIVKALPSLRSYTHFDQCGYFIQAGLIPVNQDVYKRQ